LSLSSRGRPQQPNLVHYQPVFSRLGNRSQALRCLSESPIRWPLQTIQHSI